MTCLLNHKKLIEELLIKGITFYKCSSCDEILINKIRPRSEERNEWKEKYEDRND